MHKRFKLIDRLLVPFPIQTNKTKNIWIHALSVGEVISAVPLIKMLKERWPDHKLIFTVKTRSGLITARNLTEKMVDRVLPMPLDFWWAIKRICRIINPSLYILIETDLWPGTLARLKHQRVPAILVNGRISPRTFNFHKKFAFITRRIWDSLDICLMQTEIDRSRLLDLGVAPVKVKTVGNIKFDQEWKSMDETEKKAWYQRLGLKTGDRIWVAGSIHKGEFEIILDAFKKVRKQFPDLRLIIAPRRIEQAGDIRLACECRGLLPAMKTELPDNNEEYQVLILDTMGELGRIYGLAEMSFVGGSLVPIGGHNLLEPASFGQPVLVGPFTHNFELMTERLIEKGGGKRIPDGEGLADFLAELLLEPSLAQEMGLAAREFVDMNRGAIKRVKQEIENTLAIS